MSHASCTVDIKTAEHQAPVALAQGDVCLAKLLNDLLGRVDASSSEEVLSALRSDAILS